MSIWGRYMIDKMKSAIGNRIRLPGPPAGSPNYWQEVYKNLQKDDCFEWGGLKYPHLKEHNYRLLMGAKNRQDSTNNEEPEVDRTITTTFEETIGVVPIKNDNSGKKKNNGVKSNIMILGCGNSALGEDLIRFGGYAGGVTSATEETPVTTIVPSSQTRPKQKSKQRQKILQVDVSSRVLETMSERCAAFIDNKQMDLIHDDATQLSAFNNDSIDAIIDKGCIDTLFCSNEFDQIDNIMLSSHRILRPNSILCILSFSTPQYLMPKLTSIFDDDNYNNDQYEKYQTRMSTERFWKDIQLREIDGTVPVFMYRFQKNSVIDQPMLKISKTYHSLRGRRSGSTRNRTKKQTHF